MAHKKWIILVLFILQTPLFLRGETEENSKQYETYVYEIAHSFATAMKEELNLQWIEWHGAFHDYLEYGVGFYAFRHATLDEARALELAAINKYIEIIQAHEQVQPYLKEKSISTEDAGARVGIKFVQPNKRGYNDGSIDRVGISWNDFSKVDLCFESINPFSREFEYEDSRAFETLIIESLEDATKLNSKILIKDLAAHTPSDFEDNLDQVLITFKSGMENKHHISFDALGWRVPKEITTSIDEIRARCKVFQYANQEEARALMLLTIQKLLHTINNNETLRPYLKEYPFPADRLKFCMLFRRNKPFVGTVPYYDGTLESIVLDEGVLTYYHHVKDKDSHECVPFAEESFQEAEYLNENTPSTSVIRKISRTVFNIYNGIASFIMYLIVRIFLFLYLLFGSA